MIENSSSTRILIITGTHGAEDGFSGHTDKEMFDGEFFEQDEDAVAKFKSDERTQNIQFKVINIKHYSFEGHGMGKLTGVVDSFCPTVIIGAFCFSNLNDGDVKMHLKALHNDMSMAI